MRYAVTDVTVAGATTVEQPDPDKALSSFAMLRADPRVFYAQVVQDGRVIRQFARHADTVQNIELEA